MLILIVNVFVTRSYFAEDDNRKVDNHIPHTGEHRGDNGDPGRNSHVRIA